MEPIGTSKSIVDRRLITETKKELEEIMNRSLAGHVVIVALGVNHEVCKQVPDWGAPCATG